MNLGLLKIFLLVLFFSNQLFSEPLQMNYAKFKLLDKISNQLFEKTISVNSAELLGSLNIEVYSCLAEPPDEIPENYVNLISKNLIIKVVLIFIVFFLGIFLLDKIDFPKPTKLIKQEISNDKLIKLK